MKGIVIGTAGHVDHGKTTLIKKITGIDTDSTEEEKRRGVSINLGFANIKLSDGELIGVVDVPGHEKFIKNMVAGVTGINYIMMVIDIREGIKEQTIEHLNILKLLGIRDGMVVLTKGDKVEKENIEERKKEIVEGLKDTFLNGKKVVVTAIDDESSYEKLLKDLEVDLLNLKVEGDIESFRMAIDRSFNINGFGVVVTGTTLGETIKVGDKLTLYPNKKEVKIRGIQRHGVDMVEVEKGNRCAINLSNIELLDVKRGDILASKDNLNYSNIVDVKIDVLKGKKIKNNLRVRIHIGTREVIGRIKIFNEDILDGKKGYGQLLLEKEILGFIGEVGIIRSYSPMDTIGGFKVLNPTGVKVKRKNKEYVRSLEIIDTSNREKILEEDISKVTTLKRSELFGRNYSFNVEETLDILLEKKIVVRIGEDIIHSKNLKRLVEDIVKTYKDYLEENRLSNKVPIGKVREKLILEDRYKGIVKEIVEKVDVEEIRYKDGYLFEEGYKVKLTKEDKKIKDKVLTIYKENGFSPLKYEEINKKVGVGSKEMLKYLIEIGLIIPLDSEYGLMKGFFKEGLKKIAELYERDREIKLKDVRTKLGTSRKYALLFLEKLDSLGITRRVEDIREVDVKLLKEGIE